MADKLKLYLNKLWVVDTLLFLTSFCIYFFYFHHVFLNLNGLLSSITGDSIKNYYTFVYHIKNDPGFLNFAGMNFPFGEHVVYTDSHPGLTLILQYLPFTHEYLIGIMHFLIFFSYLIAPSVTNRIFMRLGLDKISGFFISIGLTLLAPQFFRLYAGHFSMAYAFIIPLSALLILNFFRARTNRSVFNIFIYNLIIFFIHPYLAFGLCTFTLLCLVMFELPGYKSQLIKKGTAIFFAALFPMLVFKLFLLITDHHLQRPTLPYGLQTSVCTFGSLLVPTCGPFEKLMTFVFHTKPGEFEGYCYMGIAFITITIVFMLLLPFLYKRLHFNRQASILLLASLILLVFSFGVHLKLADINSETLNQFRALGRFSWFFYYMLPIFIFTCLYQSLRSFFSEQKFYLFFGGLTFLFCAFNVIEGGALFRLYESTYFQDRNFFSEKYLNPEEKQIIAKLKADKPQAILPLPTFNIGSEIYDRVVGYYLPYSLIPSFIYSHHTGLPIASAMLSRNPIVETEDVIQLLNTYKKQRTAVDLLNDRPFFVIKTKAPLLPDEERILQRTNVFHTGDSLEFGYLPEKALLSPILDKKITTLKKGITRPDSNQVVYIQWLNKIPYVISNSDGYSSMYKLDSNTVQTGRYIVSFRYYHKNDSWKNMLCHFLLTKSRNGVSEWNEFISMRYQSSFYKGYSVFEYFVTLEKESSYEFIIKSDANVYYKMSDFMLRPNGTSVKRIIAKNDTVYNNFPMY